MADKIGRFKNAQAEADYLSSYDAIATKWPVPVTELDVETSFGTTRVQKSGDAAGTPIVMLPGMPGNGLFWMPFIEELSRDHTVYTIDPLGWAGRSRQRAPIRTQADIARWLVEVFDGLDAKRVHLAGYSGGSWLSLVCGAHYSERLASLTMLEPDAASFIKPQWKVLFKFMAGGINPTRPRMAKLLDWLTPGVELDEDHWAMVLAALKYRMTLPWSRLLTEDQFAKVTAPLMVLFGARTVANDARAASARARELFPKADIEVYPGVGHEMLWAIPDQVLPRFLAFVDKHDHVTA
ncbi:alpha/beta fold hydrolase [Nocardia sp. NBC_00511]|uniref:alpha/beta fold hydrolase n=1 Tax=Nocardia sp. NBC_00511 TaxID=2903591 RepID=UPI0030DEB2B9